MSSPTANHNSQPQASAPRQHPQPPTPPAAASLARSPAAACLPLRAFLRAGPLSPSASCPPCRRRPYSSAAAAGSSAGARGRTTPTPALLSSWAAAAYSWQRACGGHNRHRGKR